MRRTTWLVAAALLTGGVAWAEDRPGVGDTIRDMAKAPAATMPTTGPAHVRLPEGITPKDLREENDIRNTLSKIVNDALDKDGFDNFVGRFVTQDRTRLKEFADQHAGDLNAQIDAFRKEWKQKYNQDFDVAKGTTVFNDQYAILQGEISNPAMLSNWPLDPTPGSNIPRAKGGDDQNQKLDRGRNVAVVLFPASHGSPELTVSMIHEAIDSWTLDVPDNLDGQRLLTNLKDHLFELGQMKDRWPADVNEAYRMVAHHVLMAVYNIPSQQGAKGAMDRMMDKASGK